MIVQFQPRPHADLLWRPKGSYSSSLDLTQTCCSDISDRTVPTQALRTAFEEQSRTDSNSIHFKMLKGETKAEAEKRKRSRPSNAAIAEKLRVPKSVFEDWTQNKTLCKHFVDGLFDKILREEVRQSVETGKAWPRGPSQTNVVCTMIERYDDFMTARHQVPGDGEDTTADWEEIEWWAYYMWRIMRVNKEHPKGMFYKTSLLPVDVEDIIWKSLLNILDKMSSAERRRLRRER